MLFTGPGGPRSEVVGRGKEEGREGERHTQRKRERGKRETERGKEREDKTGREEEKERKGPLGGLLFLGSEGGVSGV